MHVKIRKIIPALLAFVMLLSLQTAMPPVAGAANANALKTTIESFNHGGSGALYASASGSTVTVTGNVAGAARVLNLNISDGVTVLWKAGYSGSRSGMINIIGSGTLELPQEGVVTNTGAGPAITVVGACTLLISGGSVSGTDHVIIASDDGAVKVSGGSVSAVVGPAINVSGETACIELSGGAVIAADGPAIAAGGVKNSIEFSGGFVFAYGNHIVRYAGDEIPLGDYVIDGGTGPVTISGDAVVCAWNHAAGLTEYTRGSSEDLTVSPSEASAKWGLRDSQGGINYSNGSNAGFFPVSGINVSATAGSASMSNFETIKTFTPGMFTDVDEDMWYGYNRQRAVAAAYEYDLMQGDGAATFAPRANFSIAHALAVAARVNSIYKAGTHSFVQGDPWFQVYVDYCNANDIVEAGDFAGRYTQAATRAEIAYIFSRVLPATEYASQNTVNSLPDVNSDTPYHEAIFMLYRAGIAEGSGEDNRFNPRSAVSRAEAAAMIARVILPAARFSGRTYGYLSA